MRTLTLLVAIAAFAAADVTAQGHAAEDAAWSEDKRVVLSPSLALSAGDAPVQLELTGSSWLKTPASLEVVLETSAANIHIVQTLALFDHVAGAYVTLDQRQTLVTDASVHVPAAGDPSRFIAPDGTIKARVSFEQAGPVLNHGWTASVDQLRWRLTR